jgi:hypothetical protein
MMLYNGDETAGDEEKKEKKRELSDPIKDIENASKTFFETMTSLSSLMKSFVTIFSQLEGIATSFNKSMGGADIYGEKIKENIIQAKIEAEKYGFTIEDVNNTREKITETEKTNFLLQSEQYKQLLVQGELTKGISESASQAAVKNFQTFKDLGFTVQGTLKGAEGIIQSSLGLGVSTNAVFAEINKNTKTLNLYNFEDGVKGMARMASEAIMVKANMGDTLKIASKLFDPQQAVDMAAGLQRMGVQITGLLDPISLMNMGENDPEALQKNLVELSKQYVEFDEKQQRFKIMPGAQRQIREIATTLGIGAEEFAKMGINALDLDRKLSQIKFPDASEFANDDTRKLIANMAQFNEKTGKYEIEVYDEELGKNVTKAVDELEAPDLDMMEKAQKAASKSSETLLFEANRSLENIYNTIKAGTTRIPTAAVASKIGKDKTDFLQGTALPLTQALDDAIFGEGGTKELKNKFDTLSTGLDNIIKSVISGQKSLSEAGIEVGGAISTGLKEKIGELGNIDENFGKYQKEAFESDPSAAKSQFQLTPEMLTNVGSIVQSLFGELANMIPLEDGLISPNGGLIVSGPKGSYFGDKDDSVLLSPNIPSRANSAFGGDSEGNLNSKVTAEGKVEIEHKFTGVEAWFKDYMLSQGFLADFVPTMEKFLTKTEG